MKPVLILCMAAFCAVVSAQTVTQANGLSAENGTLKTSGSARTLFADDFTTAKDGSWKINNYQNRLKIERKKHNGKSAIVVTNGIGKAMDTAFDLIVLPLEVENLKQYSITFSASASFYTEGLAGRKLSSQNRIVFLDAAQKVIKAEKFRFSSSKKGYKENVISGTAPAGTKYVSIAFGADTPDVRPGNFVAIADLKIRVVDTLPAWDANSGAKVVLSDDFSKDSGAWEPAKNYKNVLKIERKTMPENRHWSSQMNPAKRWIPHFQSQRKKSISTVPHNIKFLLICMPIIGPQITAKQNGAAAAVSFFMILPEK